MTKGIDWLMVWFYIALVVFGLICIFTVEYKTTDDVLSTLLGFKKEYETRIFELFQRLHGRNEYSGTGIGLAIVKKIVINHNGFIVAEGKEGIGSTFIIYIPTI